MTFKIIVYVVFVLFYFSPTAVFAGWIAGTEVVDKIYAHSSKGIQIISDAAVWKDQECSGSVSGGGNGFTKILIIADSESSKSIWMSQLLSSQAQGKQTTIWVDGCFDWNGVSYPKVAGIYSLK